MLEAEDLKITMIEGDFGIVLPITISAEQELTPSDKFSINIYKDLDGEALVSKEYSNLTDNTIEFKLTLEESLKLPVGNYIYDIDWYQDESFLANIVCRKKFIVLNKAGKVGTNGDTD